MEVWKYQHCYVSCEFKQQREDLTTRLEHHRAEICYFHVVT